MTAGKTLQNASLLFYRCAQRESDPYLHDLFLAYYANTLEKAGHVTGNERALALAAETAERLKTSQFDDVAQLVADIHSSRHSHASPTQTRALPATQADGANRRRTAAYCDIVAPTMEHVFDALGPAVIAAQDAGTNDTQVLAGTTDRYGSAFKAVEDDYNLAQSGI